MKNFLKSLLLTPNKELKEVQEEVLKQRQSAKDRFANNLKAKLFFNDDEIKEVFSVIDNFQKKIDTYTESIDYKNYDYYASKTAETDLSDIQEEMMESIENKIKEIMAKKVERAKKFFNKE